MNHSNIAKLTGFIVFIMGLTFNPIATWIVAGGIFLMIVGLFMEVEDES